MNSFQKILLALPAALLAFNAFAQPPANPYDPKAKAILDEVSKTAKSYTSITATFTISIKKPGAATPETKNGTVTMKSGKYKIVLENKVGDKVKKEEYYNDGKTTWVYSEKDYEVTIDNAPDPSKKNENTISPNDIFTIHEKGFKYTFVKEETQKDGKVVQLINLFPEKPEKKNYSIVKLTIDKIKKQIIKVDFVNKDGSTTTYTVKTFTPNLDTPDNTYQFDVKAHPGIGVIDLREE